MHCLQILVTKWCHKQGGASCSDWKLGHQVAQQNLVIRWHHLHCWPLGHVTCIATLPWIVLLALSASFELVSSSVKSTQGVGMTEGHPDTKIGPGIPGSDKKVIAVTAVLSVDPRKVSVGGRGGAEQEHNESR